MTKCHIEIWHSMWLFSTLQDDTGLGFGHQFGSVSRHGQDLEIAKNTNDLEIAKNIEINAQKLLKNLWKRHLKNLKNLWKSMKTAGPIWMDYLNNAYERNITIRLDSIRFDCKNEQHLANQIPLFNYFWGSTTCFVWVFTGTEHVLLMRICT